MNPIVNSLVTEIDDAITSLQAAKAAILGDNQLSTVIPSSEPAHERRTMSPAARKRIAEASRKRWAERRRQLAAKATK